MNHKRYLWGRCQTLVHFISKNNNKNNLRIGVILLVLMTAYVAYLIAPWLI
jgi:hypothetical protein